MNNIKGRKKLLKNNADFETKKYNSNLLKPFIKCDEIDRILNYPEPETFRCIEKIYNKDAFHILSNLDPLISGYSQIENALYGQCIDYIKILKKHLNKGSYEHTVDYKKTFKHKGRYYQNSFKGDTSSFQGIKSIVRRLLINGNLTAIDMVNAHISIILNICRFLKLPYDSFNVLDDFCKNRENILEDIKKSFDCNRKTAKEFFIIILYGGSYNTWLTERKLIKKEDCITPFMKMFIDTFNFICSQMQKLECMNGFRLIEKELSKKEDFKINKSSLAIFLQEIESKILICLKNKLEDLGCNIRIVIHDAIWFEDLKDVCSLKETLKFLSDYIKQELDLDISLDYEETSPNENDLKWFNDHKDFYNKHSETFKNDLVDRSDIVYAKNILKHFEGKCFIIDKGVMAMYDDGTGMWSLYEGIHRKICLSYSHILFPNIYETDTKKSFDCIFNTAYKNVKSLAPKIDDWISNDNQIGFLLFQNGVLDMKNFKMLPFDQSYRFMKRIERTFDINKDFTDGYNQIFFNLYDKQFTNNIKKQYFIEKLARGIAGEYKDRQFVLGIGATACGKGKQTKLLKNSFGSYVAEFNGEELLDKSSKGKETSRELSFLMEIYDCRISISNELEIKVEGRGKYVRINGMNNNRIKKMTGGDVFSIRELYCNPISVINKSMPILLLNDIPEVNGVDEAYINRANYITYDRCSSTSINEDNDMYFKANDNIDDFINDNYIIDSYVFLICKHYKNSIINRLDRPDCVKTISKEMSGFNDCNDDYFKSNYKITDTAIINSWIIEEKNTKGICRVNWDLVGDNFIECSKVYKTYLSNGFLGSKISLGKKLINIGIISSTKYINGLTVYVYVGITDKIPIDFINE